jgi:hypothetical protein
MSGTELEPTLALVGNVVAERLYGPFGEIRTGTKHFVPGAKVYVNEALGDDAVYVTGQHRGSKRLVSVVTQRKHLHNWRPQVVYKPAVLRRLDEVGNYCAHFRADVDQRAFAEEVAERWNGEEHFSVREQTEDAVGQLISGWEREGFTGLEPVRRFPADRWLVLFDRVDPIGVGVGRYDRRAQMWIKPERSGCWGERELVDELAIGLPRTVGQLRRQYDAGLSEEELRGLPDVLAETFEALGDTVFSTPQDERNRGWLTTLATAVVRSELVAWPAELSGHEARLTAGWLGGAPIDDLAVGCGLTRDQVRLGVVVLRRSGAQVVDAAIRALAEQRIPPSFTIGRATAVAHSRLVLGTNSPLASELLCRIFQDDDIEVCFARAAASTLATQFTSTDQPGADSAVDTAANQKERFHEFVVAKARSWVDQGLLEPASPAEAQRYFTPRRWITHYRIEQCPPQDAAVSSRDGGSDRCG